MNTAILDIEKKNLSKITIKSLRENFPNVYRTISKRIGTGNIFFTREIKLLSGEIISQPYIFLTKSNRLFEIKELGSYIYLELIGDENIGLKFRIEYNRIRFEAMKRRRKLKKQKVAKTETAQAA